MEKFFDISICIQNFVKHPLGSLSTVNYVNYFHKKIDILDIWLGFEKVSVTWLRRSPSKMFHKKVALKLLKRLPGKLRRWSVIFRVIISLHTSPQLLLKTLQIAGAAPYVSSIFFLLHVCRKAHFL